MKLCWAFWYDVHAFIVVRFWPYDTYKKYSSKVQGNRCVFAEAESQLQDTLRVTMLQSYKNKVTNLLSWRVADFQTCRLGKPQSFKVTNLESQRVRKYKVSKVESYKLSKLQSCKVQKLQRNKSRNMQIYRVRDLQS